MATIVSCCLLAKLFPTLCDYLDCSPPGSSVHGISQARILERVAIPSPGNLPDSGTEPKSLALAGGFFTVEPPGKPRTVYLKVTKRADLKILITRKKIVTMYSDGCNLIRLILVIISQYRSQIYQIIMLYT